MQITLSPDTLTQITKIGQIFKAIGLPFTVQELVERMLDDGAEVTLCRLSLALETEPEPGPHAAA